MNRPGDFTPCSRTDPRAKRVLASILGHRKNPDALIEVLHTAQDVYGYLPSGVIAFISAELKIPPSRIYGIATFYHYFSLKPKGRHNCLVCIGTACYVKGARNVIDEIARAFSVNPGECTKDGQLGLQTARCIGACGHAPAVVWDDEILPKTDPGEICGMIRGKLGHGSN